MNAAAVRLGRRRRRVRHHCAFKGAGGSQVVRVLMAIKIAQRALGRNLMRSSLTMLGVIIGVGAVIAMVAIGQGAHASIKAKIANLGANSLLILSGSTTQSGVRIGWGGRATLRPADVKAIQIQNMPFRVIGLLAPKGQSTTGQDQDDVIIIPYTTSQKKLVGITHVH